MMRECHLNTCPVGVATQDPVLRKKFSGKPEHVVNYFFFVAEECPPDHGGPGLPHVRRDGRSHGPARLQQGHRALEGPRPGLHRVFYLPNMPRRGAPLHEEQDHGRARARRLADRADRAGRAGAGAQASGCAILDDIRNVNRTVGTILSSEIASAGTARGPAGGHDRGALRTGAAGQSFGAFLARGITLNLIGDANDYVGKGLSGGKLIVRPNPKSGITPEESIIVGNTVLYGAITGECYFRGIAGERFAVRNSGAHRGRGGRRRPRLRVHDRRTCGGTRRHGPQFWSGHERRHRLRVRRGRRVRAALQHRDGGARTCCSRARDRERRPGIGRRRRGGAPRADRDRHRMDRFVKGREDPATTGRPGARERFVKVIPRDYKRALAGLQREGAGAKARCRLVHPAPTERGIHG